MKIFKKIVKIFVVVVIIIILGILTLKLLIKYSENKSIKQGNIVIEKIEEFSNNNGRLPVDLNEVLNLDDLSDTFYYDISQDGTYILSFSDVSVGESISYYSRLGKWNN